MFFKAAGRNVFVLNSPEVVHELLEKRSNIYSDRPVLPLGGEIIGWGRGTVLSQHEVRHKTSRKLLAQTMGNLKQSDSGVCKNGRLRASFNDLRKTQTNSSITFGGKYF